MKDDKTTNIWIGAEDLTRDEAYNDLGKEEFVSLPIVDQMSEESAMEVGASRRDFLKYLGFGLGAATLAASCDIPVKKAIPYVIKPDSIVPGIATYYASTFVKGGDYCSVLVKTREGRPIKIEGNVLSKVSKGGTSARAQASVLSLYDTNRFQGPIANGKTASWADIDKAISAKLTASSNIRIVTNTNTSPSAQRAMANFVAKYPNTRVVTYDAVSSSAILEANQSDFGVKAIPGYAFDKADVIVSFGADFLGTWVSPVEFARDYAAGRKIDLKNPKMSYHVQVESGMTMTGSNADNRILVKPSETGAAIVALYNALGGSASGPKLNAKAAAAIKKLAAKLKTAAGKSIVISGSNNVGEQTLVNAINNMLGNYGNTIDFTNAYNLRQGTDAGVRQLVADVNGGKVDAIFFMDGANPTYDIPNAAKFQAGLAKVGLKVSLANLPNETSAACDIVAPSNHYLESWGDAEPRKGHYSLIQPTINPIFDTRQGELSLLKWAGAASNTEQPYLEFVMNTWENSVFAGQSEYLRFQSFWDAALHNGVFEVAQAPAANVFAGNAATAAGKVTKPAPAGLEISFFETVNMGAGQYANNPWLQEMPDPITRTVWGNYLAIPIEFDGIRTFDGAGQFKGLNKTEFYGDADKVDVKVNGQTVQSTVLRQFGQMRDTVALAVGYGRENVGMPERGLGAHIGTNVFPMLSYDKNGNVQYFATAEVSGKSGKEKEFACVQYHHTMGVSVDGADGKAIKNENGTDFMADEAATGTVGTAGFQGVLTERSIINHTHISGVKEFVKKLQDKRGHWEQDMNIKTLYPHEEYTEQFYSQGHHWGLHVDLNACIGCGACQVACVAENNVPVVGKHEVFRHHEMTWMRIDRYFYGDYENPNTVYQPMMCQHCDNAPCENVCPVAATNHSSEGLNQMTYNRCIGTRYCANNCPYKVRRFNWLDYQTVDLFPHNEPKVADEAVAFGADNLTRMVLNPDVTVRTRGVIEKCSFCVQRIQEGKLTAKREGRRLRDGDIKSACQTACPTGAITFGDYNDKNSELVRLKSTDMNYIVLEETNVRSSVYYTTKVNNRDEAIS